jgi:hypothetical protein
MKMNRHKIIKLIVLFFLVSSTVIAQKFTIEPKTRVGEISPTSTESDLIKIYGKKNVKRSKIAVGEGELVEGTILFPNTPDEITIEWKEKLKYPERITISHPNTSWKIISGVKIGTTLEQLEVINKSKFKLTGFEWDYPGRTVSWENGILPVQLQLDLSSDTDISFEELNQVSGDGEFSSNNEIIRKMKLRVERIFIRWDI